MDSRNNSLLAVTGVDKNLAHPEQQYTSLGKVGDIHIAYPYGYYCNTPISTLMKSIDKICAMPLTVERPNDLAVGEPTIFHPATGSRIILRNNGDVDIYAANININAVETIINGDLTVKGNTDFIGATTSNGKDISDTHTHNDVEPGVGVTGVVT